MWVEEEGEGVGSRLEDVQDRACLAKMIDVFDVLRLPHASTPATRSSSRGGKPWTTLFGTLVERFIEPYSDFSAKI